MAIGSNAQRVPLQGAVFPLGPGGPSILYDSYMQMVSIVGVFVNIIVLVTLGPIADFGPARKIGLIVATCLCSLASVMLLICAPDLVPDPTTLYSIAALFAILASSTFSLARCRPRCVGGWSSQRHHSVYFYAWLPLLARAHPTLKIEFDKYGDSDPAHLTSVKASVTKQLSAWSVSWGFIGSIAVLGISIGLLLGAAKVSGAQGGQVALTVPASCSQTPRPPSPTLPGSRPSTPRAACGPSTCPPGPT